MSVALWYPKKKKRKEKKVSGETFFSLHLEAFVIFMAKIFLVQQKWKQQSLKDCLSLICHLQFHNEQLYT